jgi:CBS domain-containing protein
MKEDVCTVAPDDPVQLAARRMRDANIGFLPVCGPDGRVVGTITDRDIVIRLIAGGGSSTSPVSNVMTREVVACRPSDDLDVAESLSDIAARDPAHGADTLHAVSAREASPG